MVGATGVSGMRESVISEGPNQCGFHVNPNEPADIAWGIINSVQDPKRKEFLGQNGRRRVLQEFSWDVIAKKTAQVYEELLKTKNT